MSRIDQLPGIVYIVPGRCAVRSAPDACMDHTVHARGAYRFIRVFVTPAESGVRLLALIAHELQHAVEVLSDDSAMSQETVARLYERIGVKRGGVNRFETDAALAVQRAVQQEAGASARMVSQEEESITPASNRSTTDAWGSVRER